MPRKKSYPGNGNALLKFTTELSNNGDLKNNRLIIFTESKETADYLFKNLNPWNPTRMMQRVGRINRIDTFFDVIHTFNFFPTTQSNDQIKLKEAAEGKINAFLTLLGGDAELLTEGEPIGSHELFDRLTSKKTLAGEDEAEESELKYLQVIRDIREKAHTVRQNNDIAGSLITYFRRGKLQKFFMARSKKAAEELDFIAAARLFECRPDEKKKKLTDDQEFYLETFESAFNKSNFTRFIERTAEQDGRRGLCLPGKLYPPGL
jgi:hypothetical protein